MGLFRSKKDSEEVSYSSLTESDREKRIAELEHTREDVVASIEEIMKRVAKPLRRRRLARRRYPIGKGPNDFVG